MRHYRDVKILVEEVWKVSSIVFVKYSSQALKSATRSAENRRPIIPLVARAGRSHVHRIGQRGTRIVQKVCRSWPVSTISAREVLKFACSSVYMSSEFSYELVANTSQRKLKNYYKNYYLFLLISWNCLHFNKSNLDILRLERVNNYPKSYI